MRTHRFLILSEPRTGSNNLSYCLDAHPELVVGNELLHPGNGVRPSAFGLDDAIATSVGGGGYHWIHRVDEAVQRRVLVSLFEHHDGFKIHAQHVPVEMIIRIVQEFDCHVILMKRVSLFDQAISNYIAIARNRWHADEKLSRMVNVQPFEIPEEHFIQWLEWILNGRRALWGRLRTMPERVVLIEYESFYSGSHDDKVQRVDVLYHMLGLRTLEECEMSLRQPAYAKLQHYLDTSRQKLTDADLAEQMVRNLADIRQLYALWVMRSFEKLAIA